MWLSEMRQNFSSSHIFRVQITSRNFILNSAPFSPVYSNFAGICSFIMQNLIHDLQAAGKAVFGLYSVVEAVKTPFKIDTVQNRTMFTNCPFDTFLHPSLLNHASRQSQGVLLHVPVLHVCTGQYLP